MKDECLFSKEELKEKLFNIINEGYYKKDKSKLNKTQCMKLIDKYIDEICDLAKKNSHIYSYNDLIMSIDDENFTKHVNKYQDIFMNLKSNWFFKYSDNKYIFISSINDNESTKDGIKRIIKSIDYILNNFSNINEYKNSLLFLKLNNEKELVELDKKKQRIDDPIDAFKKLDYVLLLKQAIRNEKLLDIREIKDCWFYLNKNEEERFLDDNQETILYLLSMIGVYDIYFYRSERYKNQIIHKNFAKAVNWLKPIDNVEKNRLVVTRKNLYSFELTECINLYNYLNPVFDTLQILKTLNLNNFNSLRETFLYISFEHSILDEDYDSAEKLLKYKKYMGIFNMLDYLLNNFENEKDIINEFKKEIEDDYNLRVYDTLGSKIISYDEIIKKEDFKIMIEPILKFMISYYYFLKHKNATKAYKNLYSILKLFDFGFGIEYFIIKNK